MAEGLEQAKSGRVAKHAGPALDRMVTRMTVCVLNRFEMAFRQCRVMARERVRSTSLEACSPAEPVRAPVRAGRNRARRSADAASGDVA
ncbi:MAG: hypothetical protein P8Y48_12220, partial [Novosphingobium sp.]